MEYLQFNFVSTLSGIAAVLLVAFFRLHWPFRFQYLSTIYRRHPEKIMRILEKSYQKNSSRPVAMLDKSSHEIMAGNYDLAEKFIADGLTACKKSPTLFHQAMIHYLFYNLAIVYLHRGRYKEAVDVAFRVFERDNSLTNALGVIVCAQARMGDVRGALEAYGLLPAKKVRPELQLFCLAEIEAANGNFDSALNNMRKLLTLSYSYILHLNRMEIEKRMEEWTKASTQVG